MKFIVANNDSIIKNFRRVMRIFLIILFIGKSVNCFGADSVHVVRQNETLSQIANKYGVSMSAIQVLNNISNPNLLFAGKN